MAKRKMITREGTIDGIVSDALSTIQGLRDEMNDWQSNMEAANMEHLPKYEQVSECHDALDSFCDSEPDMPSEVPAGLETTLKWEESGAKKKQSRAARLSDAVSDIQRVIEHIEEFLTANQDEPNDDWQQYCADLQSIVDDAEAVEFPGMFG